MTAPVTGRRSCAAATPAEVAEGTRGGWRVGEPSVYLHPRLAARPIRAKTSEEAVGTSGGRWAGESPKICLWGQLLNLDTIWVNSLSRRAIRVVIAEFFCASVWSRLRRCVIALPSLYPQARATALSLSGCQVSRVDPFPLYLSIHHNREHTSQSPHLNAVAC